MNNLNYWFKGFEWAVTDRCNCNCLHCFHAADNDIRRDEFSREEASALLKEASECGMKIVRITGGEPTLYPWLRDVIREMRDRDMRLLDLVTNGALVDESLVSFIKELHPRARMYLSFDGIGTHDWLRRKPGSEEQVKKAIRCSKEAGMKVKINMNVNRYNREVIPDSVKMLEDMGVDTIRIIRTTEAPRWHLNQESNSLTPDEYYDFALNFSYQYRKRGMLLPVVIWQCLGLNGRKKTFHILAEKSCLGEYREDARICEAWEEKFSVQANGEIMCCEPMGGYFERYGISMGNVKRDGLIKTLSQGPFPDFFSNTLKEKKEKNPKCAACRYFSHCQGGCPVMSIVTSGSPLGADPSKCAFFENGYYKKFLEAKHIMEE